MKLHRYSHPDVWRPLSHGEFLVLKALSKGPITGIWVLKITLGDCHSWERSESAVAGYINGLLACKLVAETRTTKRWVIRYSITPLGEQVLTEAVQLSDRQPKGRQAK
jgi:DNA-binding PadR family transcriptional regulator